MAISNFGKLQGALVLVKSSCDHHHPPTALRGTIRVGQPTPPRETPVVQVEFELPQMFGAPARHRLIALDPAGLAQLLESEANGTYQITVDEQLDSGGAPR